ncbi:MAG TPA: c-type cytochrome [Miltoncostaeaceae bacterium]|nr:c-type cytochrome [Miltoncostaeaceae bacterium]
MNRAQQEAYKRDYAQAKAEGKPFFPYAIYKDHLVAIMAFAWIIGMAIWHRVEIGEPIYAATTEFVPRPEWYFFFLFELLKIFKGQNALMPVIMATFIVPNILMVLLLVTPFIDRGPERRIERRPIALATAIVVFSGLAWLTYEGATSEEAIGGGEIQVQGLDPTAEAGLALFQNSGCLSCHALGGQGGNVGPNLTNEGERNRGVEWQIEHLKNPPSRVPGSAMPAFTNFTDEQYQQIGTFLDGLGTEYIVQ